MLIPICIVPHLLCILKSMLVALCRNGEREGGRSGFWKEMGLLLTCKPSMLSTFWKLLEDYSRMFGHRFLKGLRFLVVFSKTVLDISILFDIAGGYGESHSVIVMFWEVVTQFTDKQKRLLLKFVTSCSRPPLLGFKVCTSYGLGSFCDGHPRANRCVWAA